MEKTNMTRYSLKRHLALALMFLMLFNLQDTFARELVPERDFPELVRVVEVIDGEVLKVWFFQQNKGAPVMKIIKMIGINTQANDEAYQYSVDNLLGNVVYLLYDISSDSFPKQEGMVYAHVYKTTKESVSESLLYAGLADVDERFIHARNYYDLVSAKERAKINGMGKYAINDLTITNKININTATSQQLQEGLGISEDLALKIINYRFYNKFNYKDELSFVDDSFSRTWFEANNHKYNVVTSLRYGTVNELSSLFSSAQLGLVMAQHIEQYRLFNPVEKLDVLHNITALKPYTLAIIPYLTLEEEQYFNEDKIKVANVNTSNVFDLVNATGIDSVTLQRIIQMRKDNRFTIQTVAELFKANHPLFQQSYGRLEDNLTTYTDVNQANFFEMTSLFGLWDYTLKERESFAALLIENRPFTTKTNFNKALREIDKDNKGFESSISPFTYVYRNDRPETININTAERSDVIAYLKMTDMDAKSYQLYSAYEHIDTARFNIEAYKGRFSLYTSINDATAAELKLLHRNMTPQLIESIIAARSYKRIANPEELRRIFASRGLINVYERIQKYIVYE